MKNVLYLNTLTNKGGAAKVAYSFLYKNIGKYGFNPLFLSAKNLGREKHELLIKKLEKSTGLPDFFNFKSYGLYKLKEFGEADVIHLHNIHGGYFSPLALLFFTNKPVVWTLHDEQSFTGHCAWAYECEKWLAGCRHCPDLKRYPKISKDTAAFLFRVKKCLYKPLKPTVVCPSKWLARRAKASPLLGKFDIRLINNGVDEEIFKPYDKARAREELNLAQDKTILFFSSMGSLKNPAKGGQYIKKAFERFKDNKDILFVCTGGRERSYCGDNFLEFEYIEDENIMAKFYSAADLFIYPSLADNAPLVVLESLACGTPVIAFDAGGIPEQVKHLESGYIAAYRDEDDFINGIKTFLADENLAYSAGIRGRKVVEEKFTLEGMISGYIKLYEEITSR